LRTRYSYSQSDLSALEQLATDWGMTFNPSPSKCHVLSVSKRSSHQHQHFDELCSVVLKSVKLESEKYLGVSDYPAICHGVPISLQSVRRQTRNSDLSKGTSRVEASGLHCICYIRHGMC